MNLTPKLRIGVTAALLALLSQSHATPISVTFDGDATPDSATYGALFTTIPFSGTSWSSDGDILTMNTAPIRGIWFGRGLGYGDNPGFSLASSALGNRVEARVALADNATDWSLYWSDTDGYHSSFEFMEDGYRFHTAAGSTFVLRSDMTAYHTFASHLHDGHVAYYFDGNLVGSGAAAVSGLRDFLLIGDGSGGTPTGTGSFKVDYLNINLEAGAIPAYHPAVPDAGSSALLLGLALATLAAYRRAVAPA